MIRLFLGNRSLVVALLPVVVLVYVGLNLTSHYYSYSGGSNLGFWGNFVISKNPIVIQILTTILILTNALVINAIFNWNEFLGRNSFMPSLLYVILMSFYHSFYKLDGLLLSHTFFILAIHQIFKMRQNEDGRKLAFNAAFFTGLAATFHPPIMGFLPFLYFMIWTIRPFIFREILLILIGFVLPLVYAAFYLTYSDVTINLRLLQASNKYDRHQFDFILTTGIFIISLLLSLISLQSNMKKSSNRLKKLVQILWWIIITGVVLGGMDYFLFGQIERFSLMMIPLSFLLTFSFIHKTLYYVANGLFYITLIYSVVKFFF